LKVKGERRGYGVWCLEAERNTASGNPVAGVPVLGGITGGIGKLFG